MKSLGKRAQIDTWVTALLLMLGVAMLRGDRRSPHDLIAGTYTIRENR